MDRRACRCKSGVREKNVVNGKFPRQCIAAAILKSDVEPWMTERSKVRSLRVRKESWLNCNAKLIGTEEEERMGIVGAAGDDPSSENQLRRLVAGTDVLLTADENKPEG